MSAPVTILVLDSQPVSGVKKIIDGPDRLVVVTSSSELTRHALSTMSVAVWVCDVGTPGTDLKSLIAIAESTSPGIQILFTGTKLATLKANTFIEAGHGVGFIARPFSVLEFKKRVLDCVAAYLRDTGKHVRTGQVPAMSERKNLSGSRGSANHHPAGGPDPEHYTLLELLGIGGTGTVFLARDKFLDIEVAIKVINPDLIADEAVLNSFKDEARIAMQLSHRGILRIYNFSSYRDCYYIVMELVRGKMLRDVIVENGALAISTVCQILASCADAMEYAHANNVIHNDLKPENIFITESGELKIIDFGTATLKNRAQEMSHIVGTPEYMSPEQLRCEIVGPPGDIYALGIITYLMLIGSFPFEAATSVEDLLGGVRPNFSALPTPLAKILEHATAYEASFRDQSVLEFVTDVIHICGYQWVDPNQPIVVMSGVSPDAEVTEEPAVGEHEDDEG